MFRENDEFFLFQIKCWFVVEICDKKNNWRVKIIEKYDKTIVFFKSKMSQ